MPRRMIMRFTLRTIAVVTAIFATAASASANSDPLGDIYPNVKVEHGKFRDRL